MDQRRARWTRRRWHRLPAPARDRRRPPRRPKDARTLNLDRYIERESPIHRADARIKFLVTVGLILALSLLPFGSFIAIGAAWLAVLTAAIVARIGPLRVIRASFVALPFVIAALPLLFTKEGDEIGTLDARLFTLTATWDGLWAVLTIMSKSWVSVQAATLLIFTTRFQDLMQGLERLRLPRLMVAVTSLMYRYLAVLTGEASTMMRARAARSATLPGSRKPSMRFQARVVGNLVGALFIRSYERSERIYVAMQSRGYDGRIISYGGERALSRSGAASLALVGVALILFEVVAFLWLPRP
jgi:cobalt/nickel transport system permease protein